jgi:hypothetical protein
VSIIARRGALIVRPDAVVAFLSALAALAAGAFLGLLFGIPRFTKLAAVDNSVAPNNNLEQMARSIAL